MPRRFPALAFATLLILTAAASPGPAAAQAPAKPQSMAATGDSITRAFNLCFFPFTDCPAYSWSTGTNTTVNSHARRLKITGSAFNDAISGARMADLPGQMITVAGRNVEYVTVLMGGNDVCTDTEGDMTSPSAYETDFRTAMNTLSTDPSPPLVYVVSVPNVKMLWEVLHDNSTARSRWNSYNICQSLLANPLSMEQVDVDRRERVKQRNMELNQRLRAACAAYSFCRFDGEAAFGTPFEASDVSTRDYFHPSAAGQAKLADVSFAHGYWGTAGVNAAPTAGFTPACDGLTCTFTDTSTDSDGVTGWSWNFDATASAGPTSVAQDPTYSFAAEGTYTVTLHAIDTYGATASVSHSITVLAGGGGTEPTTGTISGTVTDATSVSPIAGATVTVAGTHSATTDTSGTYTVSGLDPGTYTVTASANGYDDASQTASVVAGETTTANFALQPTPTSEPDTMRVQSLDGFGTTANRNFWRANVTVQVVTDAGGSTTAVSGATVSGTFSTGGTKSCTTESDGTCTLTSDNLRNNVQSVTFDVTGVTHASLTYDAGVSVTSATINRPA